MRLAFSILVLCAAVGCASSQPGDFSRGPADTVRGPGAVFTTVDDAAIDALAWCYVQARTEARHAGAPNSRVRGGSIRPTAGGYTYGPVAIAPRNHPSRVEFLLKPADVAHFRHYPAFNQLRPDRINEKMSAQDRAVVDELDPLKRPGYLLTPRRNVSVYTGEDNTQHMGSLQSLRTQRGLFASHQVKRGR